jgi:hypothetical protein
MAIENLNWQIEFCPTDYADVLTTEIVIKQIAKVFQK